MFEAGMAHLTELAGKQTFKAWDGNTHEYYHLMQFTGLLDKNGKEVFEGDIVRGLKGEQKKDSEMWEVTERVYGGIGGQKLFGHPMQDFSYDDNKKITHLMWLDKGHLNIPDTYWQITDCEIIGNIYENPELIK